MNTANKKKSKLYNSRVIRSELTDPSFKEGKLNVPEFLASREYEIKAFEYSQLNTKYASSTRCFQSLPRSMRRRAASHNVKRIPKRLRNRALREMQKSGEEGPSKVNSRERYKLKMRRKLLRLGAKLKLMKALPEGFTQNQLSVQEKLKLLNDRLKTFESDPSQSRLNNKNGSHDLTGINTLASKPNISLKYAKRQKHFVWLPSHVWHAKRFHMIKKWGYQIPYSPTQKCFKLISRASREGGIAFESSFYGIMIVEIERDEIRNDILKSITKLKKKIPESILSGTKSYDDWLYISGYRVGKGLVYTSNSLKKILIRVHPSLYTELFAYVSKITAENGTVFDCRYSLGSIELNGPKAINFLSKILHLNNNDLIKEMWFKMATSCVDEDINYGTTLSFSVKDPRFFKYPTNVPVKQDFTCSNEMIVSLPNERLIDDEALEHLTSPKGRNLTYKHQLSIKDIGKAFRSKQVIDCPSTIPILFTKLKARKNWCLICPWFWVLPFWIKLNQIPHLTVGGLKQMHQLSFEQGLPLYPVDYPFLKEGFLENEFKKELMSTEYSKKPTSKRPSYDKLEFPLSPFGCDWEALQRIQSALIISPLEDLSDDISFGSYNKYLTRNITSTNDVKFLVKAGDTASNYPIVLHDKLNAEHTNFPLSAKLKDKLPSIPVRQISLRLNGKGSIKDCARIYRIPENYKENSNQIPKLTDLIGFVTSGSFNLRDGTPTGIGCIVSTYEEKTVLVRNINASLPRVTELTFI